VPKKNIGFVFRGTGDYTNSGTIIVIIMGKAILLDYTNEYNTSKWEGGKNDLSHENETAAIDR